ncbi:hypothetical protein BASA82_000077 [Batrachochytrium salamandrivorans]|nr:hypothetical protein BASA81_000753 [Batrachochytrium salamandrivorans]KAH9262894.1 hypothetical protein BASA82_000077 [Batrachochytrium salamandrivorans]
MQPNLVLRLPKALGSTSQLVLWSWSKSERDLLGSGEVLLRASEANKRYAFTIPKTLPSVYLKAILARDLTGNAMGSAAPLALVSEQPPTHTQTKQPLKRIMQLVDPTREIPFVELLQHGHARELAGMATHLGETELGALHKWLTVNGKQGAMEAYTLWELVGLWRTLDEKRDKLLGLVFAHLSRMNVDTFPPHLVYQLIDTYPYLDLFFTKLIIAESKLQLEPEITLELVMSNQAENKKKKKKPAPTVEPTVEPAVNEAEAKEMTLEASAKVLMTWLIGKGGSFPLHKMEKFYSKFPEAGKVIRRKGVGNLTEWFQVENNTRGQSLKLRRSPPPAMVSDEQVLADLTAFVQSKGGRIKPDQLVDFFVVSPTSKPRLHKRLKKWVLENSTKFELSPYYLTLK